MGFDADGAHTVLVVDDDADVRATVRLMLEYLGYGVVDAAGGDEALQVIGLRPIDVVVLDVEMPHLDGTATLSALRRTHPGLPVILCSGNDRSDTLTDPRMGSVRFLQKPYSFQELADAVQAATAG